jgi:cysteine-rich repeat protein
VKLGVILAAVITTLASCDLRPPYLLVTVEDPDSLATNFARLVVGTTPSRLQPATLDKQTFPLTITVTVQRAGERDVWVEAQDENGEALARGRTTARFAQNGTPIATIILRNSCVSDIQCAGIGFCSGTRKCLDTICGCIESQCGDGFHDPMTEECDDGNIENADGCTADCRLARCGDGFVWAGAEACDDGNRQGGDGCSADCRKIEVCGDGIVDAGEACDDGNTNPNDGCYAVSRALDPNGCRKVTWAPRVVLGLGDNGNGALGASMQPYSVAVDRAGNIYVADYPNSQIRRIDGRNNGITTIAGNGFGGYSGDGGPATVAELNGPMSLALDNQGNVLIADTSNHRIRRVDGQTGVITTIAGTGAPGFAGDGGIATASQLKNPSGIAIDGQGNIYVADTSNARIRRVDGSDGTITTLAGDGAQSFAGDNGPAIGASIRLPYGVALDDHGDLFIADSGNSRIRRVDAVTRMITTLAGDGTSGSAGDGGPATAAQLYWPINVALDNQGNLFIADAANNRIRRVDARTGVISTAAGNDLAGYTGDGGLAVDAQLNQPWGVTVDAHGTIIVADTNNARVRRVDSLTAIITTIAGNGIGNFTGDGGPPTSANFKYPRGVALDNQGRLYIAEYLGGRIRKLDLQNHTIATVAGKGATALLGDGGAAVDAHLNGPVALSVDPEGTFFIADQDNRRIRRVDSLSGIITTVAGNGNAGFSGDGGLATDAELNSPGGVAVDIAGNLFVADRANHCIRRVDGAARTISTAAGNATNGYSGDGGPATAAQLNAPTSIAVDSLGNLIIGDTGNSCIRRVDSQNGTIATIAGDGIAGFSGDGGPAAVARLNQPCGVAVDAQGNIFVADMNNSRIRRIDGQSHDIATVAGNGAAGFRGDGALATDARLRWPTGVAVDDAGNLFIGDNQNNFVRRVDGQTSVITTVAGKIDGADGLFGKASLGAPVAFAALPDGSLLFTDGVFGRIRLGAMSATLLSTVAGYLGYLVDDQAPPASARYSRLLADAAGIVYVGAANSVVVSERGGHSLRKMTLVDPSLPSTWTMETLAGGLPRDFCCANEADPASCLAAGQPPPGCADNSPGYGDGHLANARFDTPSGMAYDGMTNAIYLADSGNQVIRKIDLQTNVVSTIAGTPHARGYFGEDVDASEVLFDMPQALAIGPNTTRANGSLYIADTENHRVRRMDLDTANVNTIIGVGIPGSSGVGAPARYFPIDSPQGLAVDRYGNLFISSRDAVRVVYSGSDGVVTGDDSVDTIYGRPPRDIWPEPVTLCLTGIGVAPDSLDDSTLYVLDACQGFVVALTRSLAQ